MEKENIINPIVSIIVPVFNVEEYIEHCICSILKQTFSKWELILIDDGSKDNSGSICDLYATKDPRITVIHKKNEGVSAARNTGIDIAKGEYLTFIDSDDYLGAVDTIANNISILKNRTDLDIIQFPFFYEHNGHITGQEDILEKQDNKYFYLKEEMLYALFDKTINSGLWGKFYRASIFKNIRLKVGMEMCEDRLCLTELFSTRCNTILLCSEGNYIYRMRDSSTTHNMTPSRWQDVFHSEFKLLYAYFHCSDQIDTRYTQIFLSAYKSYLTTKIAYKNKFVSNREFIFMDNHKPKISHIFNHYLNLKNRIWILLLHVLGLRLFASLYTRFILLKLSFK